MKRVEGKVAIVTGGASGIGRASAVMLAREGACVAVTDVNEEEGQAAADEIAGAGGEAVFLRLDVSSEDDWNAAIEETVARFGKLDVLFNNAAVVVSANVEDTSLEEWRWLMSVNMEGVFLGTKLAIAPMKAAGGGSIINVSSIEGVVGDPGLAAYNASKGGVRLFTKSAALHCAKAGYKIRVNSIHPSYTWTPMLQGYVESQPDPAEARAFVDSLHPLGCIGEPDDIAYGVVYLASDESKFVTGSELMIDGGYTAQ